ncbi:MAG: SMI1/KNR4 family protein, partial [Planctomycetota bacterium]
SQRITDRFGIDLAPTWREWFDSPASDGWLPGLMRELVTADELASQRPRPIWPGFMLPDTLPILGNEYGDYVCARVEPNNQFGELIYWYHGGGDWIPVGTTIAEAVLHDAIDQFRDMRTQMIRGASESRIGKEASSLLSLDAPEMKGWLARCLPETQERTSIESAIADIIALLSEEDYSGALKQMLHCGWAIEAVACDLIEVNLQKPLRKISNRDFAKACGVAWFPDFIHLLFDIESGSHQVQEIVRGEADRQGIPAEETVQDWQLASQLAQQILSKRTDLAWATAVQGWFQERTGDRQAAMETYQRGVVASSFTEQSVRLNSHAESEEYGKFALARLKSLIANHAECKAAVQADEYLSLLLRDHSRSILNEVSDHWQRKAKEAEADGLYDSAYRYFYASGWDMGVSRLSEYETILEGLARNAERAGWTARAKVAQLHLHCLLNR